MIKHIILPKENILPFKGIQYAEEIFSNFRIEDLFKKRFAASVDLNSANLLFGHEKHR